MALLLMMDFYSLQSVAAYSTNGDTTVTFTESYGQSKSRTITIPDLYQVTDISVDNGYVNYSINGDQLTVNVNGGNWINRESYYDIYKYSKTASAYRTSSSNSFSSTYNYSDSSGYSGTLSRSGSSYVSSGSAGGSRTETTTCTNTLTYDYDSDGKRQAGSGFDNNNCGSSKSYSSGGWTGTLYRTGSSPNKTCGATGWPNASCTERWTATYSGTVTKIDTRIWRQDYSGYAYMGGTSYRNHTYAYRVEIDYMRNLAPKLTLESGLELQRVTDYEGFDQVRVAGFVQDTDNDTVEITAEIEGYKKTTTVSNTLSSAPFEILFDLETLNLENGVYTVNVSAFDKKNGRDSASFDVTIRDSVFDGDYILVDEWVQFLTSVSDIEGDPIIKEQFKFNHDPTYFEYPNRKIGDIGVTRTSPYEQTEAGGISNSGEWLDSPYESFSQIGHYQVFARVLDNPKDDANFEEFQKWSKETTPLDLYVHRKPVADIEPYMTYDGNVTIIDRSLDWDKYSNGERGIKEKTWWYRQKGSSSWTSGKPTTLNINQEYEIRLRVLDYQGEYNETIEPVTLVYEVPNVPPEPGFIHEKGVPDYDHDSSYYDSPYFINDPIKIISTAYDDDLDPLNIDFDIWDPNGELIVQKTYLNVIDYNSISFEFTPEIKGEYKVTQTVDDTNHAPVTLTKNINVESLEIAGNVSHTEQWKNTLIELGVFVEDDPTTHDKFLSGEKFLLDAVVTEHPIEQVVVSIEGKQVDGEILPLDEILLPSTELRYPYYAIAHPYYMGEMFKESMAIAATKLENGSIDFVFEATWKNGTVAYDIVTVEIIDDVYQLFDFHRNY